MAQIPSQEEMNQALRDRIGVKLWEKYQSATVAVCGLGGLGSNIAVALARGGVGTLILVDFDRVDISNLNRQQYKAYQIGLEKPHALKENLLEIAPYVRVIPCFERVTEENMESLLSNADVICEAFDDPKEKSMLVNGVLERFPEKYLVAASGMAGLMSPNNIKTRRIAKRFYLCGDGVSEVSEHRGLISSGVMLCAAHQAHTVLRILAGEFDL